MDSELIAIISDASVMTDRQKGRELALAMGIKWSDLTLMATAISEIGRNIVQYAGQGQIEFRNIVRAGRRGLMIIARDNGPGIADINQAMQDGFSTSRGMRLASGGGGRPWAWTAGCRCQQHFYRSIEPPYR